jgi:hypothetical protein
MPAGTIQRCRERPLCTAQNIDSFVYPIERQWYQVQRLQSYRTFDLKCVDSPVTGTIKHEACSTLCSFS